MNSTVLILDDDPAVLELTATYLNNNGFDTLTSTSAASALEKFNEAAGRVRILIADLTLPDRSGVEVAVELKSRAPSLKTLFISGYAPEDWCHDDMALFKGFPADSARFLRKPYSGHELIARLVELAGILPPGEHVWTANGTAQNLPCIGAGLQTAALYDTMTRLAGMLELAHDALIVRSLAGEIRYWSHGAETLYGWSKDQALGRRADELLRTVFPVPFEHIKLVLHATRRWEGDLYHTVRDGGMVTVASRWAVRDAEDEQVEILEINRDISSQKRVEAGFLAVNRELQSRVEELHRAEQMFRSLLESAPDAMVIVDESGQIVLVNAQTERQFGYSREELLGQSVDMLVPERYRIQHPMHRNGYMDKPHVRSMGEGLELYGLRKSGEEFPVEISLSPIETGTGRLYSSAIRDVSIRKPLARGASHSES